MGELFLGKETDRQREIKLTKMKIKASHSVFVFNLKIVYFNI